MRVAYHEIRSPMVVSFERRRVSRSRIGRLNSLVGLPRRTIAMLPSRRRRQTRWITGLKLTAPLRWRYDVLSEADRRGMGQANTDLLRGKRLVATEGCHHETSYAIPLAPGRYPVSDLSRASRDRVGLAARSC